MLKLNSFLVQLKKIIANIVFWFVTHEKQILLLIGFIVIALLSFVFGVFKGAELVQSPIIVNKPIGEPIIIKEICANDIITASECIYVGSIKGAKYYPPSCSYAKKISKENLRCFKSDEDAIAKGYTKSTTCK